MVIKEMNDGFYDGFIYTKYRMKAKHTNAIGFLNRDNKTF